MAKCRESGMGRLGLIFYRPLGTRLRLRWSPDCVRDAFSCLMGSDAPMRSDCSHTRTGRQSTARAPLEPTYQSLRGDAPALRGDERAHARLSFEPIRHAALWGPHIAYWIP